MSNEGAASTQAELLPRVGVPIFDESQKFAEDVRKGVGIAAGDYVGILLPPGANNELVPEAYGAQTGRAGAIFLVPVTGHNAFCQVHGTAGYLIHSGPIGDAATLSRIPSLIMDEDSLAQLVADIMALGGRARSKFGRPYEEVAAANAGVEGGRAFLPFRVKVQGEGPSATGSTPPEPANATPDLPPLMAYSQLKDIQNEVASGFVMLVSDYTSRRDAFIQLLGEFTNLETPGTLEERRARMNQIREAGGALLAYIPEYLRVMRAEQQAGRLSEDAAWIEQHLRLVEQDIAMFRAYEADFTESIAALERLDESGYLNVERELAPPSIRASEDCVLEPIRIPIPVHSAELFGQGVGLSGDAVIYWTREPTATETFRMHIRGIVNVSDLRRVQAGVVRSGLKNDGCGEKQSASNDRLHANPRGGLDGRTDVASEFRVCFTFKYPCFKGWKVYSCRRQTWTRIGTLRSAALFTLSSRPVGQDIEFRVVGTLNERETRNPFDLLGDDRLKPIAFSLSVKPRRTLFSEDARNLFYLVELASEPKVANIVCGVQEEIRNWGVNG